MPTAELRPRATREVGIELRRQAAPQRYTTRSSSDGRQARQRVQGPREGRWIRVATSYGACAGELGDRRRARLGQSCARRLPRKRQVPVSEGQSCSWWPGKRSKTSCRDRERWKEQKERDKREINKEILSDSVDPHCWLLL